MVNVKVTVLHGQDVYRSSPSGGESWEKVEDGLQILETQGITNYLVVSYGSANIGNYSPWTYTSTVSLVLLLAIMCI